MGGLHASDQDFAPDGHRLHSPYWQGTAIGSIIIAAVLVERLLSRTPGQF